MAEPVQRLRIDLTGVVQGVGFRPFVYQLSRRFKFTGWVVNNSCGVRIEVEGAQKNLDLFCQQLRQQLPPLARINSLVTTPLSCQLSTSFEIRTSERFTEQTAEITADSSVCGQCLAELFDSEDRRYGYPFINCTNCGPRYSIVTAIPYDRPQTTMARFALCSRCQQEYDDPSSRRFHAQPNACPQCGPQLSLSDADGVLLDQCDPLQETIRSLRAGKIVAVKGLGGYHLVVDASKDDAIKRLRQRKQRDEKPLAVMSADLDQVRRYATLNDVEISLLTGAERPIVVVAHRHDSPLSAQIAPRNRTIGVMLPYTPLHHQLLRDHFIALVMTSGNRSDEPIAYGDDEARSRLQGIADLFLCHDREIHTRVDDSIVQVVAGQPMMLRRSRGYVPQTIELPAQLCAPGVTTLAVGGEQKNTLCLLRGRQAVLSEHIGDLTDPLAFAALCRARHHLQTLQRVEPQQIAYDLHPDYTSSRYARNQPQHGVAVQHHHAHLASCMVDNGLSEPCIGVIFDGNGYGDDGHMWGGEFLLGDLCGFKRLGYLDYVAMPGGDAATREPYRMAISYLRHSFGVDLPDIELLRQLPAEMLTLILQMIDKKLNTPLTSSCGRLFDAVAALLMVRQQVSYEGQAAVELEQLIEPHQLDCTDVEPYPIELDADAVGSPFICDVRPMVRAIVADIEMGVLTATISRRFHASVANMIVAGACHIRNRHHVNSVALSGGVFQNRYLTEMTLGLLHREEFEVYSHHRVPPNDGGLALGQAVIASLSNRPDGCTD